MQKIHQLSLRVREADEADFGRSVIRIHSEDKPSDILWEKSVNISTDKKYWITCKLKPAGATGIGHIYMDIPTRALINKCAVATRMARIDQSFDFYIKRTYPWKWIALILIVALAAILAILNGRYGYFQ